MTFTGTGINLANIISFIVYTIGTVFIMLDAVQFGDIPYSILEVFIAIMLLELLFWYIIRIITGTDNGGDEMEGTGTAGYNTEVGINAEDLDYSSEIVHE